MYSLVLVSWYICNDNVIHIQEVTFTLKEKTKPWPEGRECHTSCCIGLDTDHPQMLVSGGKNMRDIALKFDMWMLDLKTLLWKKVSY